MLARGQLRAGKCQKKTEEEGTERRRPGGRWGHWEEDGRSRQEGAKALLHGG